MAALREDLLSGRRVALGADAGETLRETLTGLGAQVELLAVASLSDEEDRVGEWARARSPLDALVYPTARAFAAGGHDGLKAALEEAWIAVREVATGALIEDDRPGRLLLVAPPPHAGPFAEAARAGLENLVRTLSVEWARYGVTAVIIAPGEQTTDEEIAALSCFVISEAGGYLSGCRLELGQVA